ncbi:MAG: hypothetical protein ACRCUT_06300 [Spirochaetota bacterium]
MKKLMAILLLASVAGCAGLTKREENPVLTPDEKAFCAQSSHEIGLDYSYDSETGLWGFFSTGSAVATDQRKKEDLHKMSYCIKNAGQLDLYPYYEKIFENYYSALFLKRHYEKEKKWAYFNYISKTLLPGTEYYIFQTELALSQNRPDIKKKIDDKKETLKKRAVNRQNERLSIVDDYK